jgi:prepilin-type N-terminal cleavage/methylation domain-containing protein
MDQKGITLIELLISLCIAAIVIAGGYQVFITQAKTYELQEAVADAQNAVRSGMQIMIDDLRMAGYDKEGNGSNVPVGTWNPVPVHEKSKIRVEWERDNDTIKAVQYFFADGKLQRDIYLNGLLSEDSPELVLDDVTGLTFTYTLSGTKVVRADVTLTVKNRTLASTVIFRNVK